MRELTRIGDVPMKCATCGQVCKFDDCEPDADGEGTPGCPQPDCGGLMKTAEDVRLTEGDEVERIGRGVIIQKEKEG